MNIHDLRAAQVRYENRIVELKETRLELHKTRASFVRYFNKARIHNMDIIDYVAGVDLPKVGYNFCYTLEWGLEKLGSAVGATAFKFGVYYGRTKSDSKYKYRFTKKFGATYQEAYKNVRQAILDLLTSGQKEDIESIIDNPLSAMFKGKILSTYFPERYLNIFSYYHLNFFLIQLDLDTEELIDGDPVLKREALVEFKNQDPVMKHWSIDLFAHFLYTEYPGRPPKNDIEDDENNPLADYITPDFPPNPSPEFITLDIKPPALSEEPTIGPSGRKKRGNSDYENEARKLRKLGDRGEKIVMDLEAKRLEKLGCQDLSSKLRRVSLESDSYGYDIHSYEVDGSDRLIEVKATRAKVGPANFFFTSNELKTAMRSENYYIYMVYDIMSQSPKVWAIVNPFNPESKSTVKVPINYRVMINAAKI